ncbi:hypothetical protein SKAU_G00091410 [Synaphobranchus kaupii]|uniref:Uncharacterized protein n=1 Tax=Synaphobranchus kaupii TaxID=118154 RepID=A0A9Q1FWK7_SYNKA|nr:hypothetical protein SKAU_G00091410 [Synaphobranchus kaupii]
MELTGQSCQSWNCQSGTREAKVERGRPEIWLQPSAKRPPFTATDVAAPRCEALGGKKGEQIYFRLPAPAGLVNRQIAAPGRCGVPGPFAVPLRGANGTLEVTQACQECVEGPARQARPCPPPPRTLA